MVGAAASLHVHEMEAAGSKMKEPVSMVIRGLHTELTVLVLTFVYTTKKLTSLKSLLFQDLFGDVVWNII